MELQAFVWIMCQFQFVLFTTKITLRLRSGQATDTKGWLVRTPNFVLFVVKTYSP